MADAEVTEEQAGAVIRSRPFIAVLAIAAVVGIVVSLAAWGFLELTHQLQVGVFQDIPDDLGESTAPLWYLLLVLDPFGGRAVLSTVADQTQFSFAASAYDVMSPSSASNCRSQMSSPFGLYLVM